MSHKICFPQKIGLNTFYEFSQGGAGVFPLIIKLKIQLKHVSIIISKL